MCVCSVCFCVVVQNAFGLVLTGVLLLVTKFITFDLDTLTVSLYIAFFGILLCCVELKFSNLGRILQRNFG